MCDDVLHVYGIQKIPFSFTIVEYSSEDDKHGSHALEYDTVSNGDVLIKEHETSDGIEDREREEEQGYTWSYYDRVIRKGKVRLGFQFFFSMGGKEQKTKNAIYYDDNISDISDIDTEGMTVHSVIRDGKPIQKKRADREEYTNAYNPQTSR